MRKENIESQEKNQTQLRLVLAAAGFFVVAVIVGCIALYVDVMNSPAAKGLIGAIAERAGNSSSGAQHDENREQKYLAAIAKHRKDGHRTKLVSELYDYGDWLYSQDRPADAQRTYAEGANEAKAIRLVSWYTALKAREGLASHRAYLANGPKPDPAPILEALKVEGERKDRPAGYNDSRPAWLGNLALVYADLGKFKEAEEAISQANAIGKLDKTDQAELLAKHAQVEVRKGDLKAAMQKLAQALALDSKNLYGETQDLFTVSAQMSNAGDQRIAGVREAFEKGDYARIDAVAEELRKSGEDYPQGTWKLDAMYDVIADIPDGEPDAKWKATFAKLDDWKKQYPKSVTPYVAKAQALTYYAWRARGSGWSSSVSQDGWQKFGDRLTQAQKELDEGAKLEQKCPRLGATAQKVALGQSMERAQYDDLVNRQIADFPQYTTTYLAQSWYLQPRWFGEEGEWGRVACAECDKMAGDAGDMTYARITWYLTPYYDNVIKEAGVDWPRAKRGFEALRKKYPTSASVALMGVRLALQADDKTYLASLSK